MIQNQAQWLSGRVLDLRPKGGRFQPHQRHCVVSLSKNINPSLVLVQPRKTRPYITERLLMRRKESNQTMIPNHSSPKYQLIYKVKRKSAKHCQRQNTETNFNIIQGAITLAYLTQFTYLQSQTTPPQYQLLYNF